MPELEATSIQMEYERRDGSIVRAIDDISLAIEPGEFVSIVGPSGCGKTTFLKIVNGLLPPTGGTLNVRGRPITQSTGDRAMVFQEASLFPWYSVARNIGYGLECQKVPKAEIARRVNPYMGSTSTTRTSSPGGCSSAPTLPAPWSWTPRCSSWMSPSRRSTPRRGR